MPKELIGARGPGVLQGVLTAGFAGNLQCRQGRDAQILVEHADRCGADDIDRSGHGIGGDGCAAGQRFQQYEAESVGTAREDEGVRGGEVARQFQALLEAGADPNAADRTGNTALHRAAMVNAGAHVLALLEAGADPQAKNAQDATFQSYYFRVPENVVNEESRGHRKAVVEWLRARDIPLEAGVSP